MWISRTIDDCVKQRKKLKGTIVFVPTMGALHEGHLSLMRKAQTMGDHVLVSIFVNPTQFGPNEDFSCYPRPIEDDLAACEAANMRGVFCPKPSEMYPSQTPVCAINVPTLASDLEGVFRPGHFQGVCHVVAKLFNIILPDIACFGQKDYQQLRVIQAMATDLCMATQVVGCPTLREPDGLAMSSRNRYLSPTQRTQAIGIYKALQAAKSLIQKKGETDPNQVAKMMRQVIQSHQVQVQYAEVRQPHTLTKLDIIQPSLTGEVVALIAAKLGKVRLIDNMIFTTPH